MKILGILTSILVVTSVFIYSMIYLSVDNKCSGVRVFDCQIENNKNLVSDNKYDELKLTGDIFLKNCKPIIKEKENTYILNYSECNLKVNISKEKLWVDKVEINGKILSREEINNNF